MTPLRAGAIALAVLAGGCATPTRSGPGPDPIDTATATVAAAFTILDDLEPAGVVAASDLCTLMSGRREYAIVHDDGTATGATLVVDRRLRGDGGQDVEVEIGEDLTLLLRGREDGGVEQPAVVAHDEKALTTFDPPLVLAYPTLPAGEIRESRAAMRVVDVRDPRKQRESGNAVCTMEYVGDNRIQTPVGVLLAQRVEVTFSARLRLARVEREETIWVVPGRGVVARDDRERLSILSLPAKSERRIIVVSE